MSDTEVKHEYLRKFESCRVSPGEFHHEQHIYLAWLYLQELPFVKVLSRYPEAIKRFASHFGAENLYHETITFAYLFLINERIQEEGSGKEWGDFRRVNEDLFAADQAAIKKYYSVERLFSDVARTSFVMPDKTE
jgi:hypothetical protein